MVTGAGLGFLGILVLKEILKRCKSLRVEVVTLDPLLFGKIALEDLNA